MKSVYKEDEALDIMTDYRGKVEYSKNDIITFVNAIYGFEDYSKYILIANEEKELPFHWLQSVEDKGPTFVVTNPFLFIENYEFEIDSNVEEQLLLENIEDTMIYSIVVIPDEVEDITVNLKSPIVINSKLRKAKQVILNEDYPFKHYIFKKGEA